MDKKLTFLDGLKHGLPIAIAYIAVSFTFGIVVTNANIPWWFATLISATNLTSAGQFAGFNLIVLGAGYFEIALAVLVINLRYSLMSLSISQQLDSSVKTAKRLIMSLFVTDEIFAVASAQKNNLNFKYFLGLGLGPYFGWTIGTMLGGLINGVLPTALQNALGIALYCMFIAIIIPPAKKSKAIITCISIATALSCAFYYIPVVKDHVSFGFSVIISSVVSSIITALLFPVTEDEELKEDAHRNE